MRSSPLHAHLLQPALQITELPTKMQSSFEKQLTSVARATHTPQTRDSRGDHWAAPRARCQARWSPALSCARDPRAAVRSQPATAGEQGSRRLPEETLFPAQLFPLLRPPAALGSSCSLPIPSTQRPFPAPNAHPAAPPTAPRGLPGRRSEVPAPAAAQATWARPAATALHAPALGAHLAGPTGSPLPQRARARRLPLTLPQLGVSGSEPAAFPKPGLSVTPPRSHLALPPLAVPGRRRREESGRRAGGGGGRGSRRRGGERVRGAGEEAARRESAKLGGRPD